MQTLLGRLPAGATAAQNTTVNLLAPSELYPLERRTEVDIRLAKILRFGGRRLDVGFDLYNLFNSNTTTAYDQTYLYTNNGATWSESDGHPGAAAGPVQRDAVILDRGIGDPGSGIDKAFDPESRIPNPGSRLPPLDSAACLKTTM